jgi:integrase
LIANFLASLFDEGYQYSSIAGHRAALSSFFEVFEPELDLNAALITKLMKGFFRQRPSKPKYSCIWDIQRVLDLLASWGPSDKLELKQLTLKTAMLLALCAPKRVSELSRLTMSSCQVSADRWKFFIEGMTKNRGMGPAHTACYDRFPDNLLLCPISTLEVYLARVKPPNNESLLRSLNKPFGSVSSTTVARWLRTVIAEAGISLEFGAHSTRSASTSAAAAAGMSAPQILAAANWAKSGSTFQKVYWKESVERESFSTTVLAG